MSNIRLVRIVLALSSLLLASICAAQQKATTSQQTPASAQNPATTSPGGGPDIIANCLNAQPGQLVVFGNSRPPNIVVCNSGIYEALPYGSGPIGILNPNPIAALDVTGATNTSLYYEIGGNRVLGVSDNLNTFVGIGAGANLQSSENSFFGYYAGNATTTGFNNTFVGSSAGSQNTTGGYNTFVGADIGVYGSNGSGNTFIGDGAGVDNLTGSQNIFVGLGAGEYNTLGNNNIYIGNLGSSTTMESSTIRIGGNGGGGYGPQTAAYIAGVYGSTSSSGIPVYINPDGQLGTSPSSLRFKEQVRDMGDATNAMMKLRPVTFLYKPEFDKGERTLQYGLIAEEVAKVYPELVAYDNDGRPYSVRYQHLATMLLNEVQKQYHRAEAEAQLIMTQEQKIDELEQRLSRLERLVPQTIAQK